MFAVSSNRVWTRTFDSAPAAIMTLRQGGKKQQVCLCPEVSSSSIAHCHMKTPSHPRYRFASVLKNHWGEHYWNDNVKHPVNCCTGMSSLTLQLVDDRSLRGMCEAKSANIQTRHSKCEQQKAGTGIALFNLIVANITTCADVWLREREFRILNRNIENKRLLHTWHWSQKWFPSPALVW